MGNYGLGNNINNDMKNLSVSQCLYIGMNLKKGVNSEELVLSIDVLPTILEIAGIDIPNYSQGTSLTPIFSNSSNTVHDYIVSESIGVGGKLDTGHRMVRTKDWKYILTGVNDEALFNLKEWQNLVKDKYLIPNNAKISK